MSGKPALARIRTLSSPQLFGLSFLFDLAIRASRRSRNRMTIDLPGPLPILYQLLYHTNDIFEQMSTEPRESIVRKYYKL